MLVINERKVKPNHIRNTFYHNIVLIQLLQSYNSSNKK
jgi:hypothetical protein